MKLYSKLLLAMVAVVLLGVWVVAWLANTVTQREVTNLMVAGGMTTSSELALDLAGYYQENGGWAGVEALVQRGRGHGMMGGQRILVADAQGQVVVDSAGQREGQSLSASELAAGEAIVAGGERVGTLIATGGAMGQGAGLSAQGAGLLARVNRAIWLAALAGTLAAVVVGSVLAYGLLRPIQALTSAAGAIARGRLAQRVPVTTRDEIGELGKAFNGMAASLEQAERLRREMTADIAHELRNPIAVLQGSLEAVVDGVLPPTADNLQPLLDQTQLLARLVDDLRTLALAEAGQLGLQRVATDPAALAQSAVAQFQPLAEAKGVSLRLEAERGLPQVELDPQRITQVLGNLLSNAIRHTPSGGSVVCRVTSARRQTADGSRQKPIDGSELFAPQGAKVCFAVKDTGTGIAAEALPHIFERFYRAARGSRSRPEGGTGLGLTIARQLVEAHGGRIWANSTPGKGTEVSFVL
jgi:signal transduction histidine kinase